MTFGPQFQGTSGAYVRTIAEGCKMKKDRPRDQGPGHVQVHLRSIKGTIADVLNSFCLSIAGMALSVIVRSSSAVFMSGIYDEQPRS